MTHSCPTRCGPTRSVTARACFPASRSCFDHYVANLPAGGWPAGLAGWRQRGCAPQAETVRGFHDRFGVKIHSFYGTTEAGGIAFDDSDEIGEPLTVGRPLPGVTVTLHQHPDAGPGTGRMHVAGDAVSARYAEGDDADAFVAGGFLTGDLGHFDAHGALVLTGRVSSFINVAGRKVQPH